jgi:hypothetical protein
MFGRAFGIEWHLFNYQALYGCMPDCYRLIEQGHTSRDRVITLGRWQLIVSKLGQ